MKLETDNLLTNQSVSMPKGQEINGGTGRPFLPRENQIKYRVNESSNTNNSQFMKNEGIILGIQ